MIGRPVRLNSYDVGGRVFLSRKEVRNDKENRDCAIEPYVL